MLTDEERLLVAVGEANLRLRLPASLIAIMEQSQGPLSGIQTAQAAISTYHSGALREYRHALTRLHPPKQWTGAPQTVAFVRSLGFGEEWAGDRNMRRDPYLEVEGPRHLPTAPRFSKAGCREREGFDFPEDERWRRARNDQHAHWLWEDARRCSSRSRGDTR